MNQRGSPNRAVTGWKRQALIAEYLEQLRKATEDARSSEPLPPTLEKDWRRDAQAAGFSPQNIEDSWVWFRRYALEKADPGAARETPPESVRRVLVYNGLYCVEYAPDLLADIGLVLLRPSGDAEQAWRESAQAAGLSPEEIEESWAWFYRDKFETPPVLEEAEEMTARETMPDSVRRILIRNPLFWFVGYDPDLPRLHGLDPDTEERNEPEQPIPDDLSRAADDWQFWDNVGHALTDPSDADAKRALDRLAGLVKLKPEHTRHLAEKNGTTMAATKRRLVQEAVLLSLGTAEQWIRIGRRTVRDDPGHPITLDDVFGREGLQEILENLLRMNWESTEEIRDELELSLGGPFRPGYLTDRDVYRNWLTKEIRRRTVELLGQDLDIVEPGRAGGGRRKEISYDETEPLPGVPRGQVGADTQAFTDNQMRATGERQDQEGASFRTTDRYTKQLEAAEKKDRMEEALAGRIDWQRALDLIQRERDAPVLRAYIACVRQEPLLMEDDAAAAQQLGWDDDKVRDVKRRLNRHIAEVAAEQRWKSLFPKGL